jgi:hypothetical protein
VRCLRVAVTRSCVRAARLVRVSSRAVRAHHLTSFAHGHTWPRTLSVCSFARDAHAVPTYGTHGCRVAYCRVSYPRITIEALSILYCSFLWCFILYGVMFLCICICLFVCACSPSLRVAIRSRFVSELQGIDDQTLATKWSSSLCSTRLKTLSICLVKASVLWPIMSHLLYNSLSRILWTT